LRFYVKLWLFYHKQREKVNEGEDAL